MSKKYIILDADSLAPETLEGYGLLYFDNEDSVSRFMAHMKKNAWLDWEGTFYPAIVDESAIEQYPFAVKNATNLIPVQQFDKMFLTEAYTEKKYICYYTEDMKPLRWQTDPEDSEELLIFDTEESAKRFANAANMLPIMDIWYDYICVTSVVSEVEENTYSFNATHFIPVMNGDDVELKEVD